MALFFDGAWFDAKLASLGLTRAVLAEALGLSESEIGEIWKDQRELSARDVGMIAALLGTSGEDVATHAGVSTPTPKASELAAPAALREIADRLSRIETAIAELTALVRTRE
jgi:transcriptional regulator with XRE-family HTH domain